MDKTVAALTIIVVLVVTGDTLGVLGCIHQSIALALAGLGVNVFALILSLYGLWNAK